MHQSKGRSGVRCRRRSVSASALFRCRVDLPGLGEPDLVGFGVCETDESLSLLDQGFAILLGDDAGAIGVREDQVVELGQEAWRSWGVRVGHWSLGHIEEFFPTLVAEDAKAPPETFDHLA